VTFFLPIVSSPGRIEVDFGSITASCVREIAPRAGGII
jgi:hypothetical protein